MKLRFNLIWLFMLTAIVAVAVVIYMRNRSLEKFLPPSTLSHQALETEWTRYHEIIAFSADMQLADVDQWYASNFNVHLRDAPAIPPGQLTFYFQIDSHNRDISVILVDTSVQGAVDNLTSYIPSRRLQELVDTNPSVVGVLFLEDLDQTFREQEGAEDP